MRVCILGIGLSSLTLAKALVNQNIYVDFYPQKKTHRVSKTFCIARVPFFTAQMKNVSNKCQLCYTFFHFSNHKRAQVPIFTPNMKKWNSPAWPGLPTGNGIFDAARDLHSSRTGARITEVEQTPSNK